MQKLVQKSEAIFWPPTPSQAASPFCTAPKPKQGKSLLWNYRYITCFDKKRVFAGFQVIQKPWKRACEIEKIYIFVYEKSWETKFGRFFRSQCDFMKKVGGPEKDRFKIIHKKTLLKQFNSIPAALDFLGFVAWGLTKSKKCLYRYSFFQRVEKNKMKIPAFSACTFKKRSFAKVRPPFFQPKSAPSRKLFESFSAQKFAWNLAVCLYVFEASLSLKRHTSKTFFFIFFKGRKKRSFRKKRIGSARLVSDWLRKKRGRCSFTSEGVQSSSRSRPCPRGFSQPIRNEPSGSRSTFFPQKSSNQVIKVVFWTISVSVRIGKMAQRDARSFSTPGRKRPHREPSLENPRHGKTFSQILNALNDVEQRKIASPHSYLTRLWKHGEINYYVMSVFIDLKRGNLSLGDVFNKIRERAVLEGVVHKKTSKRDHALNIHLTDVGNYFMPDNWVNVTIRSDPEDTDHECWNWAWIASSVNFVNTSKRPFSGPPNFFMKLYFAQKNVPLNDPSTFFIFVPAQKNFRHFKSEKMKFRGVFERLRDVFWHFSQLGKGRSCHWQVTWNKH